MQQDRPQRRCGWRRNAALVPREVEFEASTEVGTAQKKSQTTQKLTPPRVETQLYQCDLAYSAERYLTLVGRTRVCNCAAVPKGAAAQATYMRVAE